jgi:uncharacterized coiled-coil protein SlyX
MPLVAVEEAQVTKTVPFLEEAEAEFVSLVAHAANRTPFKVIKNDKGEERMPEKVIQALLIPKNTSLESLAAQEEFSWLSKASAETVQEFETYTQYIQKDLKKFDTSSFDLTPLGDTGAYAVTGNLKPTANKDDVLTMPMDSGMPVDSGLLPTDNMNAPVAQETLPVTYSFADLFWNELDAFVSLVQGSMSQSATDPKRRKATIMAALQSFGTFLSMATDAVGTQAVKVEKAHAPVTVDDILSKFHTAVEDFKQSFTKSDSIDTEPSGGDEMLFKDKDEMKDFIVDTVKETMKAEKSDQTPAETPDPTAELTKAVTDLTEAVKKLESDLKVVTEKQETIEQTVIQSPSPAEDPVTRALKGDKASEYDVFEGMFGGAVN